MLAGGHSGAGWYQDASPRLYNVHNCCDLRHLCGISPCMASPQVESTADSSTAFPTDTRPSDVQSCAACGTVLAGDFCHACGQKRPDRSHYTVGYLVGEAFREATSFDGKIWSTIRLLYLRPGQLVVDYLQGRGSLHVNPVKLFLTSLTLYFFLAPIQLLSPDRIRRVASEAPEGVLNAFLSRMREQMESGDFFDRYQLIYTLLLATTVFLSALFLKAIYRRRYFGEHLVFALYDLSFVFLMIIPASLLPLGVGTNLLDMVSTATMLTVYAVWVTLAIRRVYDARWIRVIPIAVVYFLFREICDGIIAMLSFVFSVK